MGFCLNIILVRLLGQNRNKCMQSVCHFKTEILSSFIFFILALKNLLFSLMVPGADCASVGISDGGPLPGWHQREAVLSHLSLEWLDIRDGSLYGPQSVLAVDLSSYFWTLHGAWLSLSTTDGF